MPVCSMKGNTRSCKKRYPRHTRQVIGIFRSISLIGHMYAWPFMIGPVFTPWSLSAFCTACTTRCKNGSFTFKGSDSLGLEIDIDPFFFLCNLRGQQCQFFWWYHTHIMRWKIKRLLCQAVIDLIPDAFFITIDNCFLDPMSGCIVATIPMLCKNTTSTARITKRNGEFTQCASFRNIEDRFLVIGLDWLYGARVYISIAGNAIPSVIKRISITWIPLKLVVNGDDLIAP